MNNMEIIKESKATIMYKSLSKGSENYDVIALQQLINRSGRDLDIKILVDGKFGEKTKKALISIQKNLDVEPSGSCNLLTWQALFEDTDINKLKLKNFVFAGLSEDQYFPEHQRKDIIVMHHTAGGPNPYYVRDHWQKNRNRVGTFLIIGGKGQYDGVALQMYQHPSQWAYHLNIWGNFNVYEGRKDENKNHETRMAKRTIGVELCNYGYLSFLDGKFWYMSKGKKAHVVPSEDVIDYGERGYRGKRYYHRYTNKQIETLKDFILKSAEYYGIKIKKPVDGYNAKWFDYSWEATRGEQNLISHSNVRSKSDMHPQPELIQMLNNI